MNCSAGPISQKLRRLANERGKNLAKPALLVAAVFLLSCRGGKVTATPAEAPVPVVTATVTQKDVPVEVRTIGNVLPYSTVTVKAEVTGQLTGVFFKEGQDVKKGDLLFSIDRRSFEAAVAQVESNLAKDMAQLQNAAAQAARYTELLQQGIVSKEQYDQTQANQKALEATAKADEAALENVKVQLQYCSIYSPLDGRTGNLLANQGNLISANNTPLVVINQLRPIYVAFALPESSLADVRKFQSTGELKVRAEIPNGGPVEGTLTFIDNAVDPATGTIKLRGTFPNADERLWPGLFVDVVLTLTTKPRAIVVPSPAIQIGEQGPYVFVIQQDLTAQPKPVSVAMASSGQSVIASGLQAGERVVIDGQSRLKPGTKVQVKSGL